MPPLSTPVSGRIRVGVGGWDFDPWRMSFYPPGLPRSRQLGWMAEQLPMTEVNGTFYRTQTPATFAAWAAATPESFRFAIKAPRYVVGRRALAETGELVAGFLASGLVELGPRLGPVLWQLAPTRRFDAGDIAAFLDLLPTSLGGQPLRHVIEPRHASFDCPDFHALALARGCAVAVADSNVYPNIAITSGPFTYIRCQRSRAESGTGYPDDELDAIAAEARAAAAQGLSVYVLFIAGAKERNPAAVAALLKRLRSE